MMYLGMVLGILAAAVFALWELLPDILDDRGNRNDRGKLKRPSDKYVIR
jgi:hypothetical protein